MNQDQQDKDITEVVHTTSDNATIESITKQDELTLEQMEEVVGGWLPRKNNPSHPTRKYGP